MSSNHLLCLVGLKAELIGLFHVEVDEFGLQCEGPVRRSGLFDFCRVYCVLDCSFQFFETMVETDV